MGWPLVAALALVSLPARLPKPATGPGSEIVVVLFGDSYANGQGGDTATGTLRAGLHWTANGVVLTDYLDGVVVPNTGFVKALTDALFDAGYETVRVFSWAASGTEQDVTMGQFKKYAFNSCNTAGYTAHLGVWIMSTNDCQSVAERVEFKTRLRQSYKTTLETYPGIRIQHITSGVIDPGPGPFAHVELNELLDDIDTIAAEFDGAVGVTSGQGMELGVDNVHPTTAGFNDRGALCAANYLAMP